MAIDWNYYVTKAWNRYYKRKYGDLWYKAAHDIESLGAVLKHGDTPITSLCMLLAEFEYRKDKYDFTNEAELFYIRQSGDCDDFAMFACSVLSAGGFRTQYVSVRSDIKGHAICAVDVGGQWCHVGNWTTGANAWKSTVPYNSFKELAASIYPGWRYILVRDPRTYKLKERINA